MNEEKISLTTPQSYVELYKKMGCVPMIQEFFHLYDGYGVGVMCRVLHWSKVYALSQYGEYKHEWCDIHDEWHAHIVLDDDVNEYLTVCPLGDSSDWRPHPRYYAGKKQSNGEGLVSPGMFGNDIWDDIFKARIFYFLQYLWDPLVIDYEKNKDKFQSTDRLEFIRAFIPVLEIDSKGSINKGRKDMLDEKTFADFEVADGYVKDRFKEKFGVGRSGFHKHTSANGMYYIGTPLVVKNVQELEYVLAGFTDWLYEIDDYFANGSGESRLENINFDIETPGWNSFYKVPFALHSKNFNGGGLEGGGGGDRKPRISLPLPPDKYLDFDYIKHFSDPANINEDTAKEIWKKAGY